ncbi:MAG: NTP transferase domain-containing protein [Nitrospinota bacterium]|nr:NTP transferase domain-containing protein [Nitrospinota bacterium]
MDAVILCGDKGASRMVEGESKAFLFMSGKPLFLRVALAVADVDRVARLFIIGDKAKIDLHLSRHPPLSKPVVTLEQQGSLLENILAGFIATIDGYQPGMENTIPSIRDKVVMLAPGDTPLLHPAEINEFLDGANMEDFDYVAGLTPDHVMARYLPAGGEPGISMAYMHFREGRFRINNLHVARPFACRNLDVVQLIYASRYQKDLKNIARLTRDMWEHHVKLQCLLLYAGLQAAMFLSFVRLRFLGDIIRRFIPLKSVAEAASRILGMRVSWAVTTRGGAALDVDNDIDYETMKKMFHQWKEMQE